MTTNISAGPSLKKTLSLAVVFFVVALLLFAGFPSDSYAAVIRSGEIVSVPEDAVVPGDFYGMGGDVHISGVIEGDLYVLGGTVTINGKVEGDVVVVGGTVSIHGPVGDDVRVVGGKVVIADAVTDDVIVVGGSLAMLSTAHIDGDFLFYGGQAEVSGKVAGEVHGSGESMVVNSAVGSIDVVMAKELLISDSAHVQGGLTYRSPEEFSRAPNAVIDGEIIRETVAPIPDRAMGPSLPFLFMSLFSSLVAVLLFRDRIRALIETHAHSIGLSGFLGFGALLMLPTAAAILLASVLGALAGGLVLIVYFGFLLVALILSPIVVGGMLAKLVVHEYRVSWLWAGAGVVVTQALLFVPIIGPILLSVLFLIVLGMLVHKTYLGFRS